MPGGYHCLYDENNNTYTELCDTRSYHWQAGVYVKVYLRYICNREKSFNIKRKTNSVIMNNLSTNFQRQNDTI